jgi:hypothetical protein
MLDAEVQDQRNEFVPGADAMLSGLLVSLGGFPLPNGSNNSFVGGD